MVLSPSQPQGVDKETFRQIILDHWGGFKEKNPTYNREQYEEVVQKMLGCGKEEGGYTEYICLRCGQDLRRVCFTCKSSFCLSCAKLYVDDFVDQVSRVLHPGVTYRHIILTIPVQLRMYFYRDRFNKSLLSALMRCGYECLEDVVSQGKGHDIKIGAIVVIQTHGRSGHYNPHLHIIMTSGGIEEKAGKWEGLEYIPYEMIHKKWQYHLFKMMKEEWNLILWTTPSPFMRERIGHLLAGIELTQLWNLWRCSQLISHLVLNLFQDESLVYYYGVYSSSHS